MTPKTYRFNELQISAFWIPGMWIESGEDSNVPSQRGADLSTGSGLGARIGVGSQKQGVGVLYTTTWHDENNTDTRAQTSALYFDALARHQLTQGRIDMWFTAAASLGAAWVDFDTPVYDNEVGGAAQLRFMLDFQVSRKVAFDVGMAGFIWGWPGNTGAYGAYLLVGGKLMF